MPCLRGSGLGASWETARIAASIAAKIGDPLAVLLNARCSTEPSTPFLGRWTSETRTVTTAIGRRASMLGDERYLGASEDVSGLRCCHRPSARSTGSRKRPEGRSSAYATRFGRLSGGSRTGHRRPDAASFRRTLWSACRSSQFPPLRTGDAVSVRRDSSVVIAPSGLPRSSAGSGAARGSRPAQGFTRAASVARCEARRSSFRALCRRQARQPRSRSRHVERTPRPCVGTSLSNACSACSLVLRRPAARGRRRSG